MTTVSKCHKTLLLGSLILSHHTAWGSIDLMKKEIMVLIISVPIAIAIPVPIPMPRFTNSLL